MALAVRWEPSARRRLRSNSTAQMVAEQVLRAVSDGGLAIARDLHAIDTIALEQHARALERSTEHLDQQIEHSMRELEQHLKGDLEERVNDLDHQLRDLDFSHLSEFGRSASDAAKQATSEMHRLIDRAIRNGQATLVR